MSADSAPQNLDQNIRFFGLLDSAKTAHPVPSASQINNWWMPTNLETHLLHCAAAEATTIKQVLWGEIPQLPRNQAFDSPAWLNLADYFIKSKLPLFSICVLGKGATPQAFVEDCAQQFKPTSPFALSGWPDLENGERQIISDNISRNGDFKGMFGDLRLDSSWQNIFEYQRDVLQRVLEYLKKNYKSNPLLIRSVEPAKTSTWHRIEADYDNPEYIAKMKDKHGEDLSLGFLSVLQEIKAKANHEFGDDRIKIDRWLSGRTNLYQEIYHQPRELRELLRAEIDRCYVETTGESVTDIGRFGDGDRSDTQRDIDDRFYDSLVEDSDNDPNGLKECYIIDFEHLESQRQLNEDFLNVLNDKGVASRILQLRKIRNWPDMPASFIDDQEREHLDALCKYLPNAVIQHDQKAFRFVWRTSKFLVNIFIAHGLGEAISFASSVVKEFATEAADEVADEVIDGSKAQDKLSELITRKRKLALAGILRDWLTKPIKVRE